MTVGTGFIALEPLFYKICRKAGKVTLNITKIQSQHIMKMRGKSNLYSFK
jgi:hypothetical protein